MNEKRLKELLKKRLDGIPLTTQKLRKVVNKSDNSIWYILETKIITLYSVKQMAKIEFDIRTEDIF